MAQDDGSWIKLYRKITTDTAWAQGSNVQRVLMIELLTRAWWKAGKYMWAGRVVDMQPGQLIITITELTEVCNSSRQTIRTSLDNLQALQFLTIESTNRGLLITIVKWGKYQQDRIQSNQPNNQPATNQQPTSNQPATNDQPTANQPTSSYNMYKNIKEGKEGKEYKEGEEGKKGLPIPVLETFKEFSQDDSLTEALMDWAVMRRDTGHPLKREDLPELLSQLRELSGGSVDRACRIVNQSTARKWAKFWDLKPGTFYTKPKEMALQGPPPPKPEDFPGDPDSFQQAMNAWTAQQGEDNQRVIQRLGPEPTEEEREKILKAMGHIESP